jgi:hypothetical protein
MTIALLLMSMYPASVPLNTSPAVSTCCELPESTTAPLAPTFNADNVWLTPIFVVPPVALIVELPLPSAPFKFVVPAVVVSAA